MSWKIDPSHSEIGFSVKHMMISTVRGQFTKFDGTLTLNDEHPEQSVIEGWVETASLNTHEPNRDAHLHSADFFEAEKYPKMTFRSKKITSGGGEKFKLTGDMTIKDITREITFDVTYEGQNKDPWGNTRRAFTAESGFSRKDFGLIWNVALETGGWLVGDHVKVHVELELIGQADA
jgi:polyisoprenoid-binding protein YceI